MEQNHDALENPNEEKEGLGEINGKPKETGQGPHQAGKAGQEPLQAGQAGQGPLQAGQAGQEPPQAGPGECPHVWHGEGGENQTLQSCDQSPSPAWHCRGRCTPP